MLLDEIDKFEHREFGNILTELEGLKLIYKRIKKLPIWPFNMGILLKLLIMFILPIIWIMNLFFFPLLKNNIVIDKLLFIFTFIIPLLSLILQGLSLFTSS